MGWDFTRNASKADIVRERTKTWVYDGRKGETLTHKVIGKTLWTVRKVTEIASGKQLSLYIGCDLLDSQKGFGWGYKDMGEEMHPYYYDCPLAFLDMVPVACQEWRDKVIAWHARNSRTFNVGDTVKLEGCRIPEVTITSIKPFRGIYNGVTYRLKKDLIA